MELVVRKNDLFVTIYDLVYRSMTNEEIYEANIRSDFKKRKMSVAKSVKIVRVYKFHGE